MSHGIYTWVSECTICKYSVFYSRQGYMSLKIINYLSLVAAFTMFLGITFPFFGGLLSFFGGFAFAPTTYFVRKLFESPLLLECLHRMHEWFLRKDDIIMFAYRVVILLSPFPFCSSLASCGFPSINRRSSAHLGVLTGYD